MGQKDDRHITGFAGPGDGGVRPGYVTEPDSLAQAKYAASLQGKRTSPPTGVLGRIGRFLRHLISEV